MQKTETLTWNLAEPIAMQNMLGRFLAPQARRLFASRANAVSSNYLGVSRRFATTLGPSGPPSDQVISAAQHFKRQKHLPFVLEYFMWVVFGSEALHLIWLKVDREDFREKSDHKMAVLKEVLSRLERGEAVDSNLQTEIAIMLKNKATDNKDDEADFDDDYLEKLFTSEPSNVVQSPVVETPSPMILPEFTDSNTTTDGEKKPAFFL